MLKTLFRVNERDKKIIDEEALKLCPSLKKLNQDDILFIILAYDYDSPFKRLDQDERIRKARRRAYGKDDVNPEVRLKKEIDDYRSLQYDERREVIMEYKKKVGMMRIELLGEIVPAKIKAIGDTISYLISESAKLQEMIDKEEEIIILGTGGNLSFLETLNNRRRQFMKDNQHKQETEHALEVRKTAKTVTKIEKIT